MDFETTRLLESLRVSLTALIDATIVGREEALESWNRYFDTEYRRRIAKLQNLLQAAEAEYERLNDPGTKLRNIFKIASTQAQSIGSAQNKIDAERRQAREDERLENGLMIMGLWGQIAAAVYVVGDRAFEAIEPIPSRAGPVKSSLNELLYEFQDYAKYVRSKTELILSERQEVLRNAISNSRSYKSRYRTSHLRFEQIIRAIFQQYIERPNLRNRFESNLNGLWQLMSDPNEQLSIELQPSENNCTPGVTATVARDYLVEIPMARFLGCTDFSGSAVSKVILGGEEDIRLRRLPLLAGTNTVALSGNFSLPRGLSTSSVKFLPTVNE